MPPTRLDHLLNTLAMIECELDAPTPSRPQIRALLDIARHWARTHIPPAPENPPPVPARLDRETLKATIARHLGPPLDTQADPK